VAATSAGWNKAAMSLAGFDFIIATHLNLGI
jgi:hypothetical protein